MEPQRYPYRCDCDKEISSLSDHIDHHPHCPSVRRLDIHGLSDRDSDGHRPQYRQGFTTITGSNSISLGDNNTGAQFGINYGSIIYNSPPDNKQTKCLQDLNAIDPRYDIAEFETKKDKLLKASYMWILERKEYIAFTNWPDDVLPLPQSRVLLLSGSAGVGKTMLMMGIIKELSTQTSASAPSISYFFCQETDLSRNTASAVLRSLIWQLLVQQQRLIHHLESVQKNSGSSLLAGDRAYFVLAQVFQSILNDPTLSPIYFAVDALDECDDRKPGRTELLELVSNSLKLSKNVKWLLSSRPEVHAEYTIAKQGFTSNLIDMNTTSLHEPVSAYITHKLQFLRENETYNEETLEELLHALLSQASDTFLWVALAFKELEDIDGGDALETVQEMPTGLSEAYSYLWEKMEKRASNKDLERCKSVLIAALFVYRPLPLMELGIVAGLKKGISIQKIVDRCGSFLTISDGVVKLTHQSAKDYLLEQFEARLGITQALGHSMISSNSIAAMKSILKENIYNLPYKGFAYSDIVPPNPDPLDAISYACVFWVSHLCRAVKGDQKIRLTNDGEFFHFLKEHFLHWLEASSLLNRMSDCIRSTNELRAIVDISDHSEATAFFRDMIRFIPYWRQLVDKYPLQAYAGALVFAPEKSVIRQTFIDQLKSWIHLLPRVETDWSPCLSTIRNGGSVISIALSSSKEWVVSASTNLVRVWDLNTNECIQTFPCGESVQSVAISAKGDQVVSGLENGTIKVWDVKSGQCTQSFVGHTGDVRSVIFFPQNKLFVSSGEDGAIKIWNPITGECKGMLLGHDGAVNSLNFLGTDERIASSSRDGTIKIWDVGEKLCTRTFRLNGESIHAAAFSSHVDFIGSGCIVSTAFDGLTLWNLATGEHVGPFEKERGYQLPVFSPTGAQLAVGTWNGRISVVDTILNQEIYTLQGHNASVTGMCYAKDGEILVSGSSDGTIRIWDMKARGNSEFNRLGTKRYVRVLAFSKCGEYIVSEFEDGPVQIWDVATGNLVPRVDSNKNPLQLEDSMVMTNQGRLDLDLTFTNSTLERVSGFFDPGADMVTSFVDAYYRLSEEELGGRKDYAHSRYGWRKVLGIHKPWIYFNGFRVLAIPSSFNRYRGIERGQTVCIPNNYGDVFIFRFAPTPPGMDPTTLNDYSEYDRYELLNF